MDQWIPQNVSMKYFSDRMKTFKNWPKQIVQQPKELAQTGFYYIGEGDKVKCFYCGLVLYNWLTCDNPVCEQMTWFHMQIYSCSVWYRRVVLR